MAGELVTESTVQTETPAPAVEQTPAKPDYRTFAAEADAQERAQLRGTSEPATEKPAAPTPAAKDDDDAPAVDATGQPIRDAKGKFVSNRRQREQNEQNDRIRKAVDAGLATERQRVQALERELADLRRGTQPAKPAEPAAVDDGPAEPDFEKDYESQVTTKYDGSYAKAIQAFNRDYYKWTQDTAAHAAQKAEAAKSDADAAKATETRIATFLEREEAFAASHQDYDDKTAPLRKVLDPSKPLTAALLDSEQAPALLLHFAENPDDLKRIGALGQTNLPAALRELGKLEAKYESAAAPAPAIPSRKTVSAAPAPPTTLGTRSAEPANAKEAAHRRGDYRAWATEEDREERALLAGRR